MKRLAFIAMFLFAFQSLIAASALGMLAATPASPGVAATVCTAHGPRVITLDIAKPDAPSKGKLHSAAMPHCCTGGCAALSIPALPAIYLLAWYLPSAPKAPAYPRADPPAAVPIRLASHPGRPRAPPRA